MNIYDVSKKAGVSIATVSRVLNGNHNVSEKTRSKVISAMKELDYTPNIFARGLGLNTMKTIGIMCTDSSDTYLANAVYYVEQKLRSFGYDALLCCTGNDYINKKKYMSLLLSKRVDGIILIGSQFVNNSPGSDNSYIIDASSEIPIILVNGYLAGDDTDSHIDTLARFCSEDTIAYVQCKDESDEHFEELQAMEAGHRDFVYLYTSTSFSGMNKLRGFKDAMDEAGIHIDKDRFHLCTKSISKSNDYLSFIYEKNVPFDAILTSDDSLAVGAVKFAYKHGIKVPDELEIVGYNNSVLANCTEPELSSIDSKVEQLSSNAVDLLMEVLGGGSVSNINTVTADLIKRQTTKF